MLINCYIDKITGSKFKGIGAFELDLTEYCLIYVLILWSEHVIFLVSLPKDLLIPNIEMREKRAAS